MILTLIGGEQKIVKVGESVEDFVYTSVTFDHDDFIDLYFLDNMSDSEYILDVVLTRLVSEKKS